MTEAEMRDRIVLWGRLLFARGLTAGSSGNISARCGYGFLATPTNSCLGLLDPATLSLLDEDWTHRGGDAPTKELPLHRAFYDGRQQCKAVVHLHSTYATALSCLSDTDPDDVLPPLTPLRGDAGRARTAPALYRPGLGGRRSARARQGA